MKNTDRFRFIGNGLKRRSSKGRFLFIDDCVTPGSAEDLHAMIDSAVPITRSAFCKAVDREDRKAWEVGVGYALNGRSGLLTAKRDDVFITYYRSMWRGTPCAYMKWGSFEIVFANQRIVFVDPDDDAFMPTPARPVGGNRTSCVFAPRTGVRCTRCLGTGANP